MSAWRKSVRGVWRAPAGGGRERYPIHKRQGEDISLESCRIWGAGTQVSAEMGLQEVGRASVKNFTKGAFRAWPRPGALGAGGLCTVPLCPLPCSGQSGILLITRPLKKVKAEPCHSSLLSSAAELGAAQAPD